MKFSSFCIAVVFCTSTGARAEVDDCMTGTWIAATDHLKAFYQRLQPAAPVTDVDGKTVMTIAPDGSGTGSISDFVIGQQVGNQRMTNTGQGRFAFNVDTEGDRYTIEFTEFALNIKAHMHGGPEPKLMAEADQNLADLPSRTASGQYTCTKGSLTLADDRLDSSPFPNWHR